MLPVQGAELLMAISLAWACIRSVATKNKERARFAKKYMCGKKWKQIIESSRGDSNSSGSGVWKASVNTEMCSSARTQTCTHCDRFYRTQFKLFNIIGCARFNRIFKFTNTHNCLIVLETVSFACSKLSFTIKMNRANQNGTVKCDFECFHRAQFGAV